MRVEANLCLTARLCDHRGMGSKTTFVVQTFKMTRGRLAPGKAEQAPTPNGAMKRASAEAARSKGVVAFSVTADDETGEVSDATILAQHGEIPDDFLDLVKGG